MTLVRIVKDWGWPDLMRQVPGGKGMWDGIHFTLEPVDECDYLIVLNRPSEDTVICCPPEHVWAIIQEPPYEHVRLLHRGDVSYSRVYTSDTRLRGKKYVHSQPVLPWHVNRDYDFLRHCDIPQKERSLSWITSDIAAFSGHRDRLRFLQSIRDRVEFDLYGRGFRYIEDKWDGLAPYRYSFAVENFSNSYYWSEKLADCFLAWTMPIYYGCTEISRYFPSESMVCIDINDPRAIEKIRETVASDLWYRSIDAIAQARSLVLDAHQLFPFVAQKIHTHEEVGGCLEEPRAQRVTVPHHVRSPLTIYERITQLTSNHTPQWLNKLAARVGQHMRS